MTMLNESGYSSGVVYASGVMKAGEVRRMVEDFRAQETISEMTQRILKENALVHEEIAIAANDDYLGKKILETNCAFSIPLMSSDGKGMLENAS